MLSTRASRHALSLRLPRGRGKGVVDLFVGRRHSTFAKSEPRLASQALAAHRDDEAQWQPDDHFIPGINPDPLVMARWEQSTATRWEDNLTDPKELQGLRDPTWWTGLKPEDCPGVVTQGGTKTLVSMPALDLSAPSRAAVQAYFDNTWTLTEVLFGGLKGQRAFYEPPYHDLRHPMIFYYGHVASLYINKLRVAGVLSQPLDKYYEHIFETGVDEMSWDDLSKNAMRWPDVGDVKDYRREVYKVISELIATSPQLCSGGNKAIRKDDPLWSLVMGFEHERIHLETSSVLMREMPLRNLQRPPFWPADHPGTPSTGHSAEYGHSHEPLSRADPDALEAAGADGKALNGVSAAAAPAPEKPELRRVENQMVPVEGRSVVMGKPDDFPSFGWDNEYGSRTVDVPNFQVSKYQTTNAEFLDFVKAGGYHDQQWWSADGWGWKEFRNIKFPTFYVLDGPQGLHEYRLRTIFSERPLAECGDWPAIVNVHEARAYCAWKSRQDGVEYRLMAEAEYNAMAVPAAQAEQEQGASLDALVQADTVMGASGQQMVERHGRNINLGFSSESPVDKFPANELGLHDVRGNVWEWCADHFNPLDGFKPESFYQDFSTPCFDGQHHIIQGGSFVSTGDEASRYARYHFRPHFFQNAGFRLVTSATVAPVVTGQKDSTGNVIFSLATETAASSASAPLADSAEESRLVTSLRDDIASLQMRNARFEAALHALTERIEVIENGGRA